MTHETPNLAPVVVTAHAVERFRTRSQRAFGVRVGQPEAKEWILALLARAKPYRPRRLKDEVHVAARTERSQANGEEVEFWEVDGWKLVLVRGAGEEVRSLVTCERLNFKEN